MEMYSPDMPEVDRQTAISLMIHHLQLASAYFEVVPEDWHELEGAVRREMATLWDMTDPKPSYLAASVWLKTIFDAYKALGDD